MVKSTKLNALANGVQTIKTLVRGLTDDIEELEGALKRAESTSAAP